MANTGANNDAVVTTMAVPVSTVATMGLAKPPVVAVEANLLVADAPLMLISS